MTEWWFAQQNHRCASEYGLNCPELGWNASRMGQAATDCSLVGLAAGFGVSQ
ncbi:MAG: hypothetical protein JNN30_12425 [Rhodanobacteraceae bacterium]|nr:hypothetical protein [Rhodanobacteraceae bacterium]